ncbi:MAG TPA: DUF397 domain-containing protein [Pseudonocardiaceae bacterium]|nr:DUF397 domain-containing protein [Pseudonocardiaceae bacterium]
MVAPDIHDSRWRKSSRSNGAQACVELACLTLDTQWRKSSRSNGAQVCVEVARAIPGGAIRDSKNATGPMLRVDLGALLTEIKHGRFDV